MIWVVAIGFALVLLLLWDIRGVIVRLQRTLLAASDLNAERLDDVRIATENVTQELYAKRRAL